MRLLKSTLIVSIFASSQLMALDLASAMNEVVNTNPAVLEKKKLYNAAYEDVKIANGDWFLPSIDLSGSVGKSRTKYDNNAIGTRNSTDKRIGVTLTENLFDGMGTTNNIKAQKAALAAKAYAYLQAANEQALETATSYISVIKARELLEIERDSVQQHEKIANDIRARSAGGVGVISDLKEIESKVNLAYANHITQNENLKNAQISLHRVLGRYERPQDLTAPQVSVALPQSIEEATEFAMKHNPAILIQKFNIDQARYVHKRDRKSFLPSVDFVAGYNYNDALDDNSGRSTRYQQGSAQVQANWNVFRGFKDEATSSKNISLIHAENEKRNIIIRDIIQKLQLAWTSNTMLQSELGFLTKFQNESLGKLDTYKQEFRIGKRSLLELLSAESDYNAARQKIINAQLDLILVKFRILESMGILADSVGGGVNQDVGIAGLGNVDYGFRNGVHDTLPLNYNPDRDQSSVNDDICANSNGHSGQYGCGYILDYNNMTTAFNSGIVPASVAVSPQMTSTVVDSSIEGWGSDVPVARAMPVRSVAPVQRYVAPIEDYIAPVERYVAPRDTVEYTKETRVSESRSKCSNYVAPLKSGKQYYTFKVLGSSSVYSKPNGRDIDTLRGKTRVTGYYDADGWVRVSGIVDSSGWKKYCKTGYMKTSDVKAVMKKRTTDRVASYSAPVIKRKKPKCVAGKKASYYNKKYNTNNIQGASVEDFSLSAN